MFKKTGSVVNLLVAVSLLVSLMTFGLATTTANAMQAGDPQPQLNLGGLTVDDGAVVQAPTSHRVIVMLKSPSLAEWSKDTGRARGVNGRLNVQDSAAQNYISQLKAEQAAFIAAMKQVLPNAKVGQFKNEFGQLESLSYQVVLNGLVIDPGVVAKEAAAKLSRMPQVKRVSLDYAHQPDLYKSLNIIDAAAAWNNPVVGGKSNAGAGIKFASMDGGAHKDAPMFSGVGYSYPPDYPEGGLGLTANNNGKIILSRVYFRTWDPPSAGDENPWPGVNGTEHGTHTASTAAGNEVLADYGGFTTTISGVAPRAWVMSYRVFYNSITDNGSFYDAEGIAALEDIAIDQADVLNNSWGGGPSSFGGSGDFLDTALRNVAASGVFVSMSNGNAGPNTGTGDHPSDEYINVAASSTDGTLAIGALNATAPEPIPAALQHVPFGTAEFGYQLQGGDVLTYAVKASPNIGTGNDGCVAFPAGTFTGYAALVERGTCNFSMKAYYAEQAGAEFTIIFNNAANGDTIINMAAGTFAESVVNGVIIIGRTAGMALKTLADANPTTNEVEINLAKAFQVGNRPDVIASFSSRGPGVGNVLKPDIAAPGVNILAQGYTPFATGEARHLGYGQASGTSMASPHVAGAAVMLRQIHPDWSNDAIKSALMTTSKYEGIYTATGAHAQPLDMGAGRLDLTNAADPGVILSPVNASFGQVLSDSVTKRNVWVNNIGGASETYGVSLAKFSATAFGAPSLVAMPGFSVEPASVTIPAGGTAVLTVTFDANGLLPGDHQGYVVLDGPTHDAHFPVWARTIDATANPVLLINNSNDLSGDVSFYYTDALDALGRAYDVVYEVPTAVELAKYDAVLLYTADLYQSTGFIPQDFTNLTEYANQGGKLFVMGQDFASASGGASASPPFLYQFVLGGAYVQDSVTGGYDLPNLPITTRTGAAPGLQGINLDLSGLAFNFVTLSGANVVPPVATVLTGDAGFAYDDVNNALFYDVTVHNPDGVTTPITINSGSIYNGPAGTNGTALYSIVPNTTVVGDTDVNFGPSAVILTPDEEAALFAGDLYLQFETLGNPAGEVRVQIVPNLVGDGWWNQYYIDEIYPTPGESPDPDPRQVDGFVPFLTYAGPYNYYDGTVGMLHRDQPSLERPEISYAGASVYTTFGLEGVNDSLPGFTQRADLLGLMFDWAEDMPEATIADVSLSGGVQTQFEASVTSNVSGVLGYKYRWDFGDGSAFTPYYDSAISGHTYEYCGMYTVRVEVIDDLGNHTIGSFPFYATKCSTGVARFFMPIITK